MKKEGLKRLILSIELVVNSLIYIQFKVKYVPAEESVWHNTLLLMHARMVNKENAAPEQRRMKQ